MKYVRRVLWFTGLSGSGKTTLSYRLAFALGEIDVPVVQLDGDMIRKIYANTDFSVEGRNKHLVNSGKLAVEIANQGHYVICSFISPFAVSRREIRNYALSKGVKFAEVFLECSYACCEKRDVKGLYKKAAQGKIKDFTGSSQIYERPINPDITLKTEVNGPNDCVREILDYEKL